MRMLVQRVTKASVTVDGRVIGSIGEGLLVLLGVCEGDTEAVADKLVDKLCRLRIFADEAGKTNCSLADVGGALLVVSQFTLYADIRHGNRPGFTTAGKPELANRLYEYVVERCRQYVEKVEHGEFGADMKVELLNDGPFTLILDSEELIKPGGGKN